MNFISYKMRSRSHVYPGFSTKLVPTPIMVLSCCPGENVSREAKCKREKGVERERTEREDRKGGEDKEERRGQRRGGRKWGWVAP